MIAMAVDSDDAWYAGGLRFACTRCGHCCTGDPGHVYVDDGECDRLAGRLGLDAAAFRRRYTRTVRRGGRRLLSLVEQRNNDCVFFDRARGCTVYRDRPRQCRTWPFWRDNLASPEAWAEAAAECPGIGRGERHDRAAIERCRDDDGLP